jgi:hypothetical protein
MTATITGIIGRPTRPKGLRIWAAANEDQWMQFYSGYRGRFERDRTSKSLSTEAEWFLVMSDDSEIPLPSPEKMRDLKLELEGITREFWAKALKIPV